MWKVQVLKVGRLEEIIRGICLKRRFTGLNPFQKIQAPNSLASLYNS